MWFGVVCTLIDNDVRHHSGQKILTTVMKRIVVDKSTDHAKPHFDLFFLPQYQRQRKDFFRA